MFSRIILPVVALFWVTMNVLLWRAEYGAHGSPGTAVPAEVVWRKLLTSPDRSSLNIFYHGKKIGFCHWTTRVSEEAGQLQETPDAQNPAKLRPGYHVQLDGSWLMLATNRTHFDASLDMAGVRDLQKFAARLDSRAFRLELQASAVQKTVHLKMDGDGLNLDVTFSFSELENPGALARKFGGSQLGEVVDGLQLTASSAGAARIADALKWEAWSETMPVRHASARVFHLETQLLNRYKIVILVSHVGEILKVELPDGIVLLQDWLENS